jgi:hypothetical protein
MKKSKRKSYKRIKIKRMRTKLEEIKNQDYGYKDEIENKLNFDKIVKG